MPKIVTDKERIERLNTEIANLKEETSKEISDLKKERRALKAQLRYHRGKETSAVEISLSEVEKIKAANEQQSENIERLKQQLETAKTEISSFKNSTEYYCSELGKMSLYYYHTGWECDKMEHLFFDLQTLIIKINPLNGEAVTILEQNTILAKIKDDAEYMEALKRFEPYRDKRIYPYTNESEILTNEGKALLPKYINHFIGYDY